MQKMPITLLIALCATLFANGATAQNQPLACQTEAAAGLAWENGQWATRTFNVKNFLLVQTNDTLTKDSAAKALSSSPTQVACSNNSFMGITCFDLDGNSLLFSPATLRGGISHILGSVIDGNRRDTVTVHVFSCTPF